MAEISRHKCLIYEGHPSEQLPVIIPMLREQLTQNKRCLYLGTPTMVQMVDRALATEGVDIGYETRRGSLIMSSEREHLKDGTFQPREMIESLSQFIDQSIKDGYLGLFATGDMMWELGNDRNFDHLLEYEARLDQMFREKPLQGICQYHRDTVPSRAIRDALMTHPCTYIGQTLNTDNLFYVPTELLLHHPDDAVRNRQGDWMWRQIKRITQAEKERDEAMQRLQQNEARLEARVQERTRELGRTNKELEAFSYSVSHDLRAPLRAIHGFSEAILESQSDRLNDEGKSHLKRVCDAAIRMGQLIEDLLNLSRISRGELTRTEVDMSTCVNEIIAELEESQPERRVSIAISPDLHTVGDAHLLKIALQNLLSNAWKFTTKTEHSEITVGMTRRNGENVFFVRDNGAGFNMQYADKLFGAFQRLHHASDFAGSGIGLAIVQRIISRHGGRIWAEAQENQGATFFFTLGT